MIAFISLQVGAMHIQPGRLLTGQLSDLERGVLLNIRLPRTIGAMIVGAMLAVSGAALQGLFRNPLVDAGIIGITTGATFSAVLVIAFSTLFPVVLQKILGYYLLPFFAFSGSVGVCYAIYHFSKRFGKTDISMLILAGIAFNAIFSALTGLVIYFSDDAAIRTFTFWSMGDVGGISWEKLLFMLPVFVLTLRYFHRIQHTLDVLSLGESEAGHLGISLKLTNRNIIIASAMCVGVSVAFCGSIGFVGLVVPHIIRTIFGPAHRFVIPMSVLGGAILLLLADIFARTIVMPSELPIGIITSVIGGPFFMYLLFKHKRRMQ
ncbi:MAG: iron ABC transporter permease [Cryomorphaceae bacterium]|nr:iron ABC transporter permease [Cryomorphaceae bacterium]